MFASYAVFGHHRPLNAVIVVGVVLLANMALTQPDQLPYLVVFSVASLFLLIRSHVFDEQSEWMRRRIGDPASISSVYLRGGSIFIASPSSASAVLTQTAASAPLAGAWDGVEDGLLSVSRSISRYLPTGGSSRPIGCPSARARQVSQVWNTNPDAGPHHPAQSDGQGPLLLAGRGLRQDRRERLARLCRPTAADRAADAPLFDQLVGRRRSGDPQGLRLHGDRRPATRNRPSSRR